MKKRLPIIIVFFSALMVVLFLKFLPSSAAQAKDTDGDGFSDEVDGCVSEPSSSNNGCPYKKEKTINGSEDDIDQDGFLRVEFRDGKEADKNDKDPCIPNKNCKNCDEDHDGLNLELEKAKGTNKTKADTDGDGVIDGKDTAPLKYSKSKKELDKVKTVRDEVIDLPEPTVYLGNKIDGERVNKRQLMDIIRVKYGPEITLKSEFTVNNWKLICNDSQMSGVGARLNVEAIKLLQGLNSGNKFYLVVNYRGANKVFKQTSTFIIQ
jgi:hypothetical protein